MGHRWVRRHGQAGRGQRKRGQGEGLGGRGRGHVMGRRGDVFQFQHRRSALHGLEGDEIKIISGQQTMDFILNYQKKIKNNII